MSTRDPPTQWREPAMGCECHVTLGKLSINFCLSFLICKVGEYQCLLHIPLWGPNELTYTKCYVWNSTWLLISIRLTLPIVIYPSFISTPSNSLICPRKDLEVLPSQFWNSPCLILTVASWPACRFFRRPVRWSGITISWRIFQFVVIHTVKGFSIVNEAKVDVFWNSLALSMIQQMLAIWSLVPLPFLNPACTSRSFWVMYCWSLAWRILSMTLLACEVSAIVQ